MELHHQHAQIRKPSSSNGVAPLKGLVLAGGESRRMGQDKGNIKYHSIPQREYVASLLQKFTSDVYISVHPQRQIESTFPLLGDTFLDLGPMSGVLSAFRHDPDCAWIVAACDMALLDEEIIRELVESREPSMTATCFYDPLTDLPEPLLTIWEPQAYKILLNALSEGFSCLRHALINHDAHVIRTTNSFKIRNANTPEESKSLQSQLDQKK